MEQEKLFKIGIILLFATVIAMLIYGILYISTGTIPQSSLDFIGMTEAEISAFSSELMIVISYQIRLVGIAYISLGIAYILILNFGFRKKEKWAWIALLIATVGFVGPLLLMSLLIFPIDIDIIILIITLIIQIGGAILTYKSFFGAE